MNCWYFNEILTAITLKCPICWQWSSIVFFIEIAYGISLNFNLISNGFPLAFH